MINKRNNFFVYTTLITTILIDALGVGLIYPVFATIFNSSAIGIFAPGTSVMLVKVLYGTTLGVYPLALFLGAPILGDLSDTVGRKKILLISIFNTSLCMFLCAVSIEYKIIWLLILFRFVWGFMAANMGIAQAAIIDISPKKKKAFNLSIISVASAMGIALGPVAGSFLTKLPLLNNFGYAGPFIAGGILALANGILMIFFFRETLQLSIRKKIVLTKGIKLFILGFKDHQLSAFCLVLFFIQFAWATYLQTESLRMVSSFGYTLMQLGYFISFIALVYAISYLLLIKIAFRLFTIKKLLFISNLILGFGLFIPAVHSAVFQWWAVFPICSSIGISYICILTLISNTANDSSQGAAMGIVTSVTAAGITLGSFAAGLLSVISVDMVFIFVAILPFISSFYIIPKFIPANK